jgi:hypothetical protein
MSYNRIAVLADLRTQLVNRTCNPSRGLAELAGRLVVDDTFNKTLLNKIADHRLRPSAGSSRRSISPVIAHLIIASLVSGSRS